MLHVRALGGWIKALHALAARKPDGTATTMYLEGPFGCPKIDIWGEKYQLFCLISGGIGITPMQSIANQLMDEEARGRQLKHVRFIWAVREPDILQAMKHESRSFPFVRSAQLPPAFSPDLPHDRFKSEFFLTGEHAACSNGSAHSESSLEGDSLDDCDHEAEQSLDYCRPDLPRIFDDLRVLSEQHKCAHVAVLACGPAGLVEMARRLCRDKSTENTYFDFSEDIFEF